MWPDTIWTQWHWSEIVRSVRNHAEEDYNFLSWATTCLLSIQQTSWKCLLRGGLTSLLHLQIGKELDGREKVVCWCELSRVVSTLNQSISSFNDLCKPSNFDHWVLIFYSMFYFFFSERYSGCSLLMSTLKALSHQEWRSSFSCVVMILLD